MKLDNYSLCIFSFCLGKYFSYNQTLPAMKTIKKSLVYRLCKAFSLLILPLIYFSNCSPEDDPAPNTNQVNIVSMDPTSPASLTYYQTTSTNDRVNISYNYQIAHPDGARVWVQPYTNGAKSEGFLYSKSSVLTGSGQRSVIISIDPDATSAIHVDQLRIIMTDPDQNVDLLESFVDVDYTFSD